MPTNRSTEKRNRQSIKRRLKNREAKSKAKTMVKSFEASVNAGDKEDATAKFKELTKVLDTVAGKGVYHKKTVARKKSRMSKLLNSLS